MEEETFSQKILESLKRNWILVGIGVLGVICLGVGLVTLLHKPEAEISVESRSQADRTSRTDKTNRTNSIFVDVSGAVVRPGLYELPPESRIQDAIVKAGGYAEKADRDAVARTINLAQKLQDGTKLYIPKTGESGSSVGQAVAGAQTSSNYQSNSSSVNINSASISDLDKLPGIGAVRAQKIIDGRPYSDKRDLLTKKIVTQKIYQDLEGMISVY